MWQIYTFQKGASISVSALNKEDNFYKQAVGDLQGWGEQYFYRCFTATGQDNSSLNVAVYCNENCVEGETDILWRFRRSADQYSSVIKTPGTNTDMWCMKIASMIEWPDQIEDGLPKDYENANSDEYEKYSQGISMIPGIISLILSLVTLINNM